MSFFSLIQKIHTFKNTFLNKTNFTEQNITNFTKETLQIIYIFIKFNLLKMQVFRLKSYIK